MNEAIGMAKHVTQRSTERLLKTLSFVPDDKLTWSPSPTSKSCLRVAAHVGIVGQMLAGALRGDPMPNVSAEEIFAMADKKELAITTRQEAIDLLNSSSAAIIETLDSLTAQRMAESVQTPFGEIPAAQFIYIPGNHASGHAAQIDYLQTIWGDLDPHF